MSYRSNEGPQNNKMQRTSDGQDGRSPLILVLCGPLLNRPNTLTNL